MRLTKVIALTVGLILAATAFSQSISPKLTAEVKKGVQAQLRDPSSVRILSAELRHAIDAADQPQDVVCGTLNARNSFGGMSAAAHFVYFLRDKEAYVLDKSIVLEPFSVEIGWMAFPRFCQ